MHQMKRFLVALILMTTIIAAWAKSSGLDPSKVGADGLTHGQAEQVLRIALMHGGYKKELVLPGAYIEGPLANKTGKPPVPGFFMFRLAYDSPSAGATDYIGTFVVSQKTGDVWDVGLPSGCSNFRSAALTRVQTVIMKKTGKIMHDEMHLREQFDCLGK
jgi:hypothetical protein